MDVARLDPDNLPEAPWPTDPTQPWPLQASNPRLLNALAQDFINSKFDLQALMREIVNSRTYQLSARYDGTWNPAWENLFARKLVRRLWSEEIHDDQTRSQDGAITQTLDLMNDNFVMSRVQMSRAPQTSLLAKAAAVPND